MPCAANCPCLIPVAVRTLTEKGTYLNSAKSARIAADQPSCCQGVRAHVHAQNEHAIFLNAGFFIFLTDSAPQLIDGLWNFLQVPGSIDLPSSAEFRSESAWTQAEPFASLTGSARLQV